MAVSTTEVPVERARESRGDRLWLVAAWVAVAVAVAGHVWVVRSSFVAGTPSFNFDEISSLMPGRALLGLPTPQVGGSGYFPFSAILVAPVWWFTSDPTAFYRATLVISLLLGLASIWPMARVATRLGLTTAQSVTAAAVVVALPAHAVQAEYAIAEKPLLLVVSLTALAGVRLAERPTYARVLTFSLGVALTYFTHARMITVVVAAFVWLLLFSIRHLRIGLVGLVALAVLSWAARTVALHVILLVSPAGFLQSNGTTSILKSLRPGVLARTVLGQSWEQVVSTFGLAPLGLVVAATLAVAEARRRAAGPALLLLLAVGALFAGSAIDWAQPDQLWPTTTRVRLDAWIYGRYVDPLFALVMLVALAAIVAGVRRWQLWTGAAISLAIVVATILWLAPQAPTGGTITPAHMPGATAWWWALPHHAIPTGIRPTFTNATRFWLIASITALVPVAVLLLARRRALLVLGLVLALGTAGTVAANVASTRFHDIRARHQPLVDTLRHITAEHPGTSISYFWRCSSEVRTTPAGRNRYAWLLLPTVVGIDPHADIVIACPAHPAAAAPGAVPLHDAADVRYRAWVKPGPLQGELRAEGLLR